MRRTMLLLAWMPLLLCLLAGQVRAAEDLEHEDDAKVHENARKHFSKAKLTLTEAIDLALKKFPQGKAIEAGFEVEGDDYDYFVEIASGGRHHEVEIDAVSGKIESEVDESAAESSQEDNEKRTAQSKFTLVKAIAAALEAVPGSKAFEVESQVKDGQLAYVVGVLKGQEIYDVWLDGTSGKVLAKNKAK